MRAGLRRVRVGTVSREAPLSEPRSPLATLPLSGIGAIQTGVQAVLHGFVRLARTPSLWPPVLGLALIHLVLVLTAVWFGWSRGDDLVDVLLGPAAPGWRAAVHFVAVILVRIGLIAVLVVASWITAGIFAGPLYDRLSARVEVLLGTHPPDDTGWVQILGDIAQGIWHTLLGLLLYGALNLVLLLFLLLPVAGEFLWPIGSTLLSAVFLAREVFDYPTSRRRWSFVRKLTLLRGVPHLTLGLGLATFGGLLVPGLNLVVMAAAVIGGTEVFGRLISQDPDTATPAAAPAGGRPPAPT